MKETICQNEFVGAHDDIGEGYIRIIHREDIVRCKDCKHCIELDDGNLSCMYLSEWDYYDDKPGHFLVKPDNFCCWGEKDE